MRQIAAAVIVLAGTLPLGAQERTLDARFSRSTYAEPTFYVNREAWVAVFEILSGDRVVQRYPRVEAQAATALPAGESTLAWLDVNLGRLTDVPGTRTVFYRDGTPMSFTEAAVRAPTARTMLLVVSTRPLKVAAPVAFLPLYHDALARQPAGHDADYERAVAAVLDVVHPEDGNAEVATDVQTMWLVDYPEFRSASPSAYANDPYGYGSACDAIAPYGYAAYTTWTSVAGCPSAYVGLWPVAVFFYVPRFPLRGPIVGRPRGPSIPVGVLPGMPVPPGTLPGVHRSKPLTPETAPQVQRSSAPPVTQAPSTRAPLRAEPLHQEPPRFAPSVRPSAPARQEPARVEPAVRPPEPVHQAPHPVLVAPAPQRTAPAAAGGATVHPVPTRSASPVPAAQHSPRRHY